MMRSYSGSILSPKHVISLTSVDYIFVMFLKVIHHYTKMMLMAFGVMLLTRAIQADLSPS